MNHEEDNVVGSLAELCRTLGCKVIVQVGAEDGYEAFTAAVACGGRAIAIEADERCAAYHQTVEYHYGVMGATDGPSVLYVCNPGTGLTSTLKRDEAGQTIKHVAMQRLDTFCRERALTPDALIIDTEGTTLDVLEGATGILDGVKVLYCECQADVIRPGVRLVGEVDRFLATRGFTQYTALPSYSAGAQGNYTWVKEVR